MQTTLENRLDVFDWLRAAAILMVLVLHVIYGYEKTNLEKTFVDWLSTVLRPCIAIFLFCAGTFFPVHADFPYVLKRIKRVLIPYLVFSILALLYQTRVSGFIPEVIHHPAKVAGNLLIGNTWGVYWFIPMILVNYVFAYLLLHVKRLSLLKITLFLLVVNLLHTACYCDVLEHFHITNHPLVWLYSYRFFITWPVYFFLGILIREYRLLHYLTENKASVIFAWLLIFVVNSFLLYNHIIPAGGYNSVLDTLASLSTIALLLVLPVKGARILFIGRASYTIYLSHYFFISFGQRIASMLFASPIFGAAQAGVPPFWFTWVILAFTLLGPLFFIYIVQKSFGSQSRLLFGTQPA